MIKKFFFFLLFSAIFLAILAAAAGAGAYYWFIIANPGDEIRQENIEKILAMESPAYYRDGENKIGVFFEEAHRQYLSYDEIPGDFINAIIAAEDNTFFTHPGIDIIGISRAMISNIKAGRIVQGGSTITQQTAKNLFKRRDRSIRSKLKELLFALRLEHHYSKEKIIEFYCNQFYVSGNGHGLGVAARYYFDKEAAELDLLECAFIAGSVKRPNAYNPFIQKNEEDAARARVRARERADYVLSQMYRLGMINTRLYQETSAGDIAFNRGKMSFALNTLMDLVKEGLARPEIEEALAQHGIDNIATSGIRVVTTVAKGLQEQAVASLRKQLSLLDVRLNGYDPETLRVQQENRNDSLPSRDLHPGDFLFGTVSAIDPETPTITVSFEKRGKVVATGLLDAPGLMPLVGALKKWEKNRWSEADRDDLDRLVSRLQTDDRVYVSIRERDSLSGAFLLDLEKYPQVQGGLLVLQNGRIRAMVGGHENRFYNRAIMAQRPMGSVIKPLVYAAALQLGWNATSPLNNERNLFLYQGQAYFPRPDHHSPYARVSMNWAGVKSENLATIWLLHHLCDNLTPAEFRELTDHLDLNRRTDEPYSAYVHRLRDRQGILVNDDALLQAAFRQAVAELEPDLIFAGKNQELEVLHKLHYGTNFENFAEEVEALREPGYDGTPGKKKRIEEEIELRLELLSHNYLRLRQLRHELQQLTITDFDLAAPFAVEVPQGQLFHNPMLDQFDYGTSPPEGYGWRMLDRFSARALLQESYEEKGDLLWEAIRIDGGLSVATLDTLSVSLREKHKELATLPAYSFEVLQTIPDFRVLAGLRYLVSFCRAMGIKSHLDPVLSFPLGSNVITLFEAAKAYEALTTGRVTEGAEPLAIIDRIENNDGTLIYRPDRPTRRLIDQQTTLALVSILRNVVRFGTGRLADTTVRLHSLVADREKQLARLDLRIPVLGKTGTANDFTNAAFVGMVPNVAPDARGMTLDRGYVIATYSGFDDNAPMVRTSTHITGSSGALPTWTKMANAILEETNFADKFDLIDILFKEAAASRPTVPLLLPDLGQIEVGVSRGNGLYLPPEKQGREATVITFGRILPSKELEPARYFRPYWIHEAQ